MKALLFLFMLGMILFAGARYIGPEGRRKVIGAVSPYLLFAIILALALYGFIVMNSAVPFRIFN